VGEDLVQVTSYNPRNVFAPSDAVTVTLPTDGIPLLPEERHDIPATDRAVGLDVAFAMMLVGLPAPGLGQVPGSSR